jgi:hypothetical protein
VGVRPFGGEPGEDRAKDCFGGSAARPGGVADVPQVLARIPERLRKAPSTLGRGALLGAGSGRAATVAAPSSLVARVVEDLRNAAEGEPVVLGLGDRLPAALGGDGLGVDRAAGDQDVTDAGVAGLASGSSAIAVSRVVSYAALPSSRRAAPLRSAASLPT